MIISTAVPHSQSLPAYQFGTAVHRPWVKMLGVNGQLKQDLWVCQIIWLRILEAGSLYNSMSLIANNSMKGQTLTVSSKQYQPVILRVFIIARVKKEVMDIWVWVPKFPFDFPILENIHKLSLALLLVRCSYWFAEWDLSDCPRISLLDWISTRRKNTDNQDCKRGLFSLSFHLFFIFR